jgi:hypothetical protein
LRIIFSDGCFLLAEGEMKMSLERTEAGVDDKLDENGLSFFSKFEFEIVEERVSSMISIF